MKYINAVVLLICAASGRAAQFGKEIEDYDTQVGLQAYTAATGLPLAQTNSAANLEVGQCTWFVHSVCPFQLPLQGMAGTYVEGAAKLGLAVGQSPVAGSVAVWSTKVAGTGHVAYVTAVEVEPGTFDVWDANWPADGRVRHRRHALNDDRLLGFILSPAPWAGERTEAVHVPGWLADVSPDGETVATSPSPGGSPVTLWRVSDGHKIGTVVGSMVQFSPRSDYLVAWSRKPPMGTLYRTGDSARVESWQTWEPVHEERSSPTAQFSRDGRYLIPGTTGPTRFLDLDDLGGSWVIPPEWVGLLSPDGRYLASYDGNETVLTATATKQPVSRYRGLYRGFSADGQFMAIDVPHGGIMDELAFVRLPSSRLPARTFQAAGKWCIDAKGGWVAIYTWPKTMVLDLETGETKAELPGQLEAVSVDQTHALTIDWEDRGVGTVRFYSLPEGHLLAAQHGVAEAILLADGRHAQLRTTAGTYELWSLSLASKVLDLPGPCALSSDGTVLAATTVWRPGRIGKSAEPVAATADMAETVLWRPGRSAKPPQPAAPGPMEEPSGPTDTAARSPQLAFISGGDLLLQDLDTGRSTHVATGLDRVSSLAWTRDGSEVLVADGNAILALDLAGNWRTVVAHGDPNWTIDGIGVHPSRPVLWYTVEAWMPTDAAGQLPAAGRWLWRVPLAGGPPSKLWTLHPPGDGGTLAPGVDRIVWQPDGLSAVIGLEPTHERQGILPVRYSVEGQRLALPFWNGEGDWPAACTPSWHPTNGTVLWPEPSPWSDDGQELLLRLLGPDGSVRYSLRHRTRDSRTRVTSCELHAIREWFAYACEGDLIVWDYGERRQLWRTRIDYPARFAWRP